MVARAPLVAPLQLGAAAAPQLRAPVAREHERVTRTQQRLQSNEGHVLRVQVEPAAPVQDAVPPEVRLQWGGVSVR